MLTIEDFHLGGILNPFGDFHDPRLSYHHAASTIRHFPYLNRNEIHQHFYQPEIDRIWQNLMRELFVDLAHIQLELKRPLSYFQATTSVIHLLKVYPVYNKIAALHLCGLGAKLFDAFGHVFRRFEL